MYLGPNKAARLRREYRSTVNGATELSGLWDKIQKIGYKLTKWIPRELSPTKMLKHSAKQKLKVKSLETQLAKTTADSASEIAQAKTDAQLSILQAAAPSAATSPQPAANFSSPGVTQPFTLTEQNPAQFSPTPAVSSAAPPAEDNSQLYAGLAVLGVLGLGAYLYTRNRK